MANGKEDSSIMKSLTGSGGVLIISYCGKNRGNEVIVERIGEMQEAWCLLDCGIPDPERCTWSHSCLQMFLPQAAQTSFQHETRLWLFLVRARLQQDVTASYYFHGSEWILSKMDCNLVVIIHCIFICRTVDFCNYEKIIERGKL